jgi:hypothetical protein
MFRCCVIAALLLSAPLIEAQTPPPPRDQGPGPSLTDQGFTEAEAASIQADLRSLESAFRITDADLRVIEAQRGVLMTKDTLDRGEFEKLFRAQNDLQLKKELLRVDLINKWRKAFGVDKSRLIERQLGPQQGPDQGPDQAPPPNGQNPSPKGQNQPPKGPNPPPKP